MLTFECEPVFTSPDRKKRSFYGERKSRSYRISPSISGQRSPNHVRCCGGERCSAAQASKKRPLSLYEKYSLPFFDRKQRLTWPPSQLATTMSITRPGACSRSNSNHAMERSDGRRCWNDRRWHGQCEAERRQMASRNAGAKRLGSRFHESAWGSAMRRSAANGSGRNRRGDVDMIDRRPVAPLSPRLGLA